MAIDFGIGCYIMLSGSEICYTDKVVEKVGSKNRLSYIRKQYAKKRNKINKTKNE